MFSWIQQNRLIDLARQAQRLPHILIVIPLGMAFAFVSQFAAIPVYIAQVMLFGFSEGDVNGPQNASAGISGIWMAAILVSSFSGIFLFIWLWTKFFEKRPFYSIGLESQHAAAKYLRGFVIGLAMFAGAVGLMAAFGSVKLEQGDPAMQGTAALGGVIIVLVGWVVQGAAEEVLTRGWMMPVLAARYKAWVGILVSSLIFAVLHGMNPNLSLIALINLGLFGLFAALYALREGSLWGICALHSVWNWVQGNIFGFEVSGTNPSGGMLFNLMETGPDWFTGGAFGPEGGLAVTAMLLVGMSIIALWQAPVLESQSETVQE